jgi:serine/threonine protein kinase
MSTMLSSLGKYQIIEEIGRGGMGVVYKGYDPSLKRTVAIKLLAPHLIWEKEFVERFERESRAAAQLDHPNIIHIFDVGQEGSRHYLVMSYLPGPSLKQFLGQKGRLTPTEALPLLRQLANALDYAHGKGLVHRDVKSANVMFNELGQAVLTDFGLVKAAQESKLTSYGAFMGTPQYMAPEQAKGENVDARADQYALGIITFEMMTGQVPFDADTTPAILYKQVNDPPPAVTALCRDLPPAIEPVLSRALAKLPASRYASCSEFVKALEQALQPVASPQRDAVGPLSHRQRAELRHKLDCYFSEEELRNLCFDLGIDYEALPAQGKSGKARELIAELERKRRLDALVALCRQLRPDASWAEIIAAKPSAGFEQEQQPVPISVPPPRPTVPTHQTSNRWLLPTMGAGGAALVIVALIILSGIGPRACGVVPTTAIPATMPADTWTPTPTPTWTWMPTPTPTWTWTPTPTPTRTWTPIPSTPTWTRTHIPPTSTWTRTPIPPRPDLVVSIVSIDRTIIVQGQQPWTWITYRVSNVGQVSTPAGMVYLRNWVNNAPASGYMTVNGPISPGGSVEAKFAVGHDNGWPVGKYTVQVEVDYQHLVDESNENNNVSAGISFVVVSP